jgi:single-stranded-DNA-specific exonuclease
LSADADAPLTGLLDSAPASITAPPLKTERRGWILPGAHLEIEALAEAASIPSIIARLLYGRGIRTLQQAELFLSPRFDALHDPYAMLGMGIAVERIQQAIARRETILIYGDYDVDGTVAVVLLKTAIEVLGGICRFHVPHRLRDGYGMQAAQLSQAVTEGVQLVISVDNGIRAFAAAEEAQRLG